MRKENTCCPLVSIVVITYNSMPYIIETLNSIKAQTYKNLELIVSDDCSPTDNTVESVKEWIKQNKERFVKAELITTPYNTGISSNCNRGCRIAEGEWLKVLGGDDILKPTYVEEIVNYCYKTGCDIACCDIELFGEGASAMVDFWNVSIDKLRILQDASSQNKALLQANFIPASSLIYKRTIWNQIGGYDEECKLLEDYPFNVNVTSLGYHIGFLDKKLVMYRENPKSVRYNPDYLYTIRNFAEKYIYKVNSDAFNGTTVTTIILAHNNKDTIARTIESALWQIGNFKHNIAVIDNVSSDNIQMIIEEMVSQYPDRIVFVKDSFEDYFTNIDSQYISILCGNEAYEDNQDLYERVISIHVNILAFPYKLIQENSDDMYQKNIRTYRFYTNTRKTYSIINELQTQLNNASESLLSKDREMESQNGHIQELLRHNQELEVRNQELEARVLYYVKRNKFYRKLLFVTCVLFSICISLLIYVYLL